jgi:hypothetical protein
VDDTELCLCSIMKLCLNHSKNDDVYAMSS